MISRDDPMGRLSSKPKMILITSAGGKTGKAILKTLIANGEAVRVFVRNEDRAKGLIALGAWESVVGDLRDEAALRHAMNGVTAVYHICPNVNPDEVAIGRAAISAAQATGISHFVFHSVLHPQAEGMPHHWNKMRVEEMLFESHLPFTILQPTAYMQNILGNWKSIIERGVYVNPYPVETQLSLVDLQDVAEAATRVLTEPNHNGATYELVGTMPMTQIEVATVLSQQLKRDVRAESESVEAWKARTSSLTEYQIETLSKMFLYYERHGLHGRLNVLRWLLGREPRTLAEFVKRETDATQAESFYVK